MNVLIIGGSNSRRKVGYTKFLFEELLGHTSIDKFTNIALGANTCLMGLISLAELSEDHDYNLIMLEYSVNDYAMTARGETSIWSAAFEGLIRQVCRRWPNAIVCCVILGRSNVDKLLWESQILKTHIIASHYPQVVLADVQGYLPQMLPSERLYDDPMHYSREASEIAGPFIANLVLSRKCSQSHVLPAPLNESVFDPVGVLDFANFKKLYNRVFSNSIITLNTMELALGDSFEFTLPGPLISVVFVSTQGAGSFRIESGGQSAVIHTLHKGVRDGKHAFLPLSTYGSWWKNPFVQCKVRITTIPHHRTAADWPTNLGVSSSTEKPAIFLSKILYRTH